LSERDCLISISLTKSNINFLAHLYLSDNDRETAIGNFLGDFVKGKDYLNYPENISKGIVLHREIDRFTDNHEIALRSKDKLRVKYRHYAGVIVDMFYDHFLAKNFSEYHILSLKEFTEKHFIFLMDYIDSMPDKAQRMLPYMIRNNWLLGYAQIEGLHRALSGMSRRTKFDSKMDQSVQELVTHYDAFENEFREFFPIVKAHVSDFKKDLIIS
jgi:acyl carrier protein phosphodiesterase